ncbi:MAG: hypothetical protein KKC51_07190, partial [Verrucomicrobia bacterium]|nr:hypothetical protein [Verrucomicrobiota bacterium]
MKKHPAENERRPGMSVSRLQEVASALPPKTVVIVGGDRKEDLLVAKSLQGRRFVKRCLLVGNGESIRNAARRLGISVAESDIIATQSQKETARRTVELVEQGEADILLKGDISTPVLNREMLKIKSRDTISLVTLFQSPCLAGGRPVLITDAGVTTICNFSRMCGIIRNAVEVAHFVLDLPCPRVALLSANEKVIESLASSKMAAALSKKNWEGAVVYGPLSFDLATEPESVRIKGISKKEAPAMREVAGQADILVCPSLDAANILYKTIMSMTRHGMAAMAGITAGVNVPYIILSRADGEATKLDSIALCCIYAERQKQGQLGREQKNAGKQKAGRSYHILAVNPGSTSVKVALYRNEDCLDSHELTHPHKSSLTGAAFDEEVGRYIELVKVFLKPHAGNKLDAVVGRGGFLHRGGRQIEGGVYQVAAVWEGRVMVEEDIVRG